jgi:hypothetical protein
MISHKLIGSGQWKDCRANATPGPTLGLGLYATSGAFWFPIGGGVFKKPGHKGPNQALDQGWRWPTILLWVRLMQHAAGSTPQATESRYCTPSNKRQRFSYTISHERSQLNNASHISQQLRLNTTLNGQLFHSTLVSGLR